jgi:hypothetical protein
LPTDRPIACCLTWGFQLARLAGLRHAQNWFTGEDFEDFDEHEGLNLIIR